ncbi:MAG: acyltransferase family protein [Haloechinothrix sp.]
MITEQAPRERAAGPGAHYMYGLDLLRVLCAAAVVYVHIMGWALAHDYNSLIIEVVEGAIVRPLHLAERLGFVGLCSFLLITGVVISHVSAKETSGQFLSRRGVRLAPALWIAVPLAWLLALAGLNGTSSTPDVRDLLLNMVLLNHTVPGSVAVLGVTWTLLCQVVFYLFVAATIPIMRRRPWLPAAIAASVLSVLASLVAVVPWDATGSMRMFATFLPIIFIGQVIGLTRSGRITPLAGMVLAGVHLWLGVRAVLSWPESHHAADYARTLVLLVLVLLLLTRADGRIARSPVVRGVAKRTYAIYLLHMPLMIGTLELTADHIGFYASLALATGLLVIGVELVRRCVDEPITATFRRWENNRAARTGAPR